MLPSGNKRAGLPINSAWQSGSAGWRIEEVVLTPAELDCVQLGQCRNMPVPFTLDQRGVVDSRSLASSRAVSTSMWLPGARSQRAHSTRHDLQQCVELGRLLLPPGLRALEPLGALNALRSGCRLYPVPSATSTHADAPCSALQKVQPGAANWAISRSHRSSSPLREPTWAVNPHPSLGSIVQAAA
jgi:hypothetical protein